MSASPFRGMFAAIVVAATVTTLPAQWGVLGTSNTPSARSEALLAFDLNGNRMLMFGGNVSNEFWSLSNGVWTQLQPAVLPGPRRRMNQATDPLSGSVWMYGGQDGSSATALDETWHWDGSNWQLLTPVTSPGGLMWHAMAFDSVRQTVVAFGGRRNIFSPSERLDETWEFANGTWALGTPVTTVPPPALQPAMAFHPVLNKVLMFGGETTFGVGLDETWTWDGTDWQQINLTGPRPPARSGAQLLQILNRGIVVLFGGRDPVTFEILNDTWEHDGTQWREVSNVYGGVYPPRAEAAVAHDINRDRIVLFGGKIANQGLRNDTWEYGAQWQPFGMGCPGSAGTPQFTGVDLPRLATTASARIDNVPPAMPVAFVAIGLSRTQWALGSLPYLLTPLGMPGCRLYTSADLIVAVPATAGVATWTWNVPNQQQFVGFPFHLQGITFDPGINALDLAMSNAATLVVGN